MSLVFDQRPSDACLVEKVWHAHSDEAGLFTSIAASHWEMVVTKYQDRTRITVRGPETKATPAESLPDAEHFGIIFKLGTYMPHLPVIDLIDRKDLNLPAATSKSFYLYGVGWQFPTYENADTFVNRMMREGLLAHDEIVDAVLQDQAPDMSVRHVRRRFLHATGLTHGTIRQIERARHAMLLLRNSVSILDTVFEAGYYDQAHLTCSLKRFTGQTPSQLMPENEPPPTSLLYNTISEG